MKIRNQIREFRGDRTVAIALGVGFFFHLWAAIHSVGFYHWDEHFQILEFVGFKLGISPAAELPWEFAARIRPWFLPALLTLLTKLLIAAGIKNPFTWTLIYRTVTALLGWTSLVCLLFLSRNWLSQSTWKIVAILTGTLSFIPYLHARVSSETWSGSLFFIGFSLLLKNTAWRKARVGIAGVLLGLAFECRFQTALMIGPLFIWYFFFSLSEKEDRFQFFSCLSMGFVFALVLGIFIDHWGSGDWEFTAWNYFKVNLVEHRAEAWGTQPWWGYCSLLAKALPPFGFLVLVGTLSLWVTFPKAPLTWVTLPFVIVHSLISHKELRFLFPLADCLPVAFGLVWTRFYSSRLYPRKLLSYLWLVNCGFLVVLSSIPARTEIQFLSKLYTQPIPILFIGPSNPFIQAGLPIHFYRNPQTKIVSVANDKVFYEKLVQSRSTSFLVDQSGNSFSNSDLVTACHVEFSTPSLEFIPKKWIRAFSIKVWKLYVCKASL